MARSLPMSSTIILCRSWNLGSVLTVGNRSFDLGNGRPMTSKNDFSRGTAAAQTDPMIGGKSCVTPTPKRMAYVTLILCSSCFFSLDDPSPLRPLPRFPLLSASHTYSALPCF